MVCKGERSSRMQQYCLLMKGQPMQSLIGAAYVNIGAAHVFCMTARIFGSHSFRCGRGQGTGRIQGEALYFGKLVFDQADGVWMDVTQRIRVSGCAKPCVLVVNAPLLSATI